MKLGVLVNNLGASQLNFNLIRHGNAALKDGRLADLIVFYENAARPCLPMNFAAMQIAEAWAYDGVIVATDLSTAAKLIRFPSAEKKFFYLWDLEWLRGGPHRYRDLEAVYNSTELRLLSRSLDHDLAIRRAWHHPHWTVDDFNIDELVEAVEAS